MFNDINLKSISKYFLFFITTIYFLNVFTLSVGEIEGYSKLGTFTLYFYNNLLMSIMFALPTLLSLVLFYRKLYLRIISFVVVIGIISAFYFSGCEDFGCFFALGFIVKNILMTLIFFAIFLTIDVSNNKMLKIIIYIILAILFIISIFVSYSFSLKAYESGNKGAVVSDIINKGENQESIVNECNKLYSTKARYDCLFELAMKTKDTSLCPNYFSKIPPNEAHRVKFYCIKQIMGYSDTDTFCSYFKGESDLYKVDASGQEPISIRTMSQGTCFETIALDTLDENICLKIPEEATQPGRPSQPRGEFRTNCINNVRFQISQKAKQS